MTNKKQDKMIDKIIKLREIYDKQKKLDLTAMEGFSGKRNIRYKILVKLYDILEYGWLSRKEFDYLLNKLYE